MKASKIVEQLETEIILLEKWIDNPEISSEIKYGKVGFCHGLIACARNMKSLSMFDPLYLKYNPAVARFFKRGELK